MVNQPTIERMIEMDLADLCASEEVRYNEDGKAKVRETLLALFKEIQTGDE